MLFNPYLHALRGIAAASVLLFHWYQFFPAAADLIRPSTLAGTLLDPTIYLGFGWMGVPLFFVLSGYLLGAQVIGADINTAFLKRFWLRRFLRIYPAGRTAYFAGPRCLHRRLDLREGYVDPATAVRVVG